MIKINLTRRIWLAFVSLIVLVALSIIIVYPLSIRGALTEETYQIIDNSVEQIFSGENQTPEYLPGNPVFMNQDKSKERPFLFS